MLNTLHGCKNATDYNLGDASAPLHLFPRRQRAGDAADQSRRYRQHQIHRHQEPTAGPQAPTTRSSPTSERCQHIAVQEWDNQLIILWPGDSQVSQQLKNRCAGRILHQPGTHSLP